MVGSHESFSSFGIFISLVKIEDNLNTMTKFSIYLDEGLKSCFVSEENLQTVADYFSF